MVIRQVSIVLTRGDALMMHGHTVARIVLQFHRAFPVTRFMRMTILMPEQHVHIRHKEQGNSKGRQSTF